MIKFIGISGLGRMGLAMAQRLLDLDFTVIGYDIDPARCSLFQDAGGLVVQSNFALGSAAQVVLSCLPSGEALLALVSGQDGLAKREEAGSLTLIECSTLAIHDKLEARRLAASRGVLLLDCPISGGPSAARDGKLTVFASGDQGLIEQHQGIFDGIATSCHIVGDFGMGTKMKFLANLLVAIHNVSAAEVLTLGAKAGFEPEYLCDVLITTSGDSEMLRRRGPRMARQEYDSEYGIALETFAKDLLLISDFGRELECPLPLFSTATQLYLAAKAQGFGGADTSSVGGLFRSIAGLDVFSPPSSRLGLPS